MKTVFKESVEINRSQNCRLIVLLFKEKDIIYELVNSLHCQTSEFFFVGEREQINKVKQIPLKQRREFLSLKKKRKKIPRGRIHVH